MKNKKGDNKPPRMRFNQAAMRTPDKTDPATGYTRLITAMHYGNTEAMKKLLKAGANPDLPDAAGRTPLQIAAAEGWTGALHILLQAGANPDLAGRDGKPPLFHAVTGNNPPAAIAALTAGGADAGRTDRDGRIALHAAAESGDVAVVRQLLAVTQTPDKPDARGIRPLHLAAEKNGADVLAAFFYERVAFVNAPQNGNTVLHSAVLRDDDAVFDFLMETDARMLATAANLDGETPLHIAARQGRADRVRALVAAGGDVNAPDAKGHTPLHAAVTSGDIRLVRLMVENGADVGKTPDRFTVPPMGLVFSLRLDNAIAQLLLDHGADPAARGADGVTVLMRVAEKGDDAMLRHFLQAGADPSVCDRAGNSVLHYCNKGIARDTVGLLVAAGAPVQQKNNDGRSALLHALIETNAPVANGLLDHGAQGEEKDKAGYTPLTVAYAGRMFTLARRLVDAGAHPDTAGAPAHNNMTPLHAACLAGASAEVEFLLSRKAKPNPEDNLGRRPLHLVIHSGNLQLRAVQLMLDAGADPSLRDRYGASALDMARNRRKIALARMFEAHLAKQDKNTGPKPPFTPPGYYW